MYIISVVRLIRMSNYPSIGRSIEYQRKPGVKQALYSPYYVWSVSLGLCLAPET